MKPQNHIERERETIRLMIQMYCKHHHGSTTMLCTDCNALNDYAQKRIEKCLYGYEKPACSQCPIHCYKADMRQRIREVMRFAGPRMIYTHPYHAMMHIVDKIRYKKTEKPQAKGKN